MDLCGASHELFCVFGDFYVTGTQDAEEANSLLLYYYYFFVVGRGGRNPVMLDLILKNNYDNYFNFFGVFFINN